jgi:hypothetical protein
VREYPGDRLNVLINEQIVKSWTLRNDGQEAWPENTKFIQTNGDDLKAEKVYPIGKIVKSGEEIVIQQVLHAPSLPGKYCAFFRLAYPIDGEEELERFGQKVWCEIIVLEPEVVDEFPQKDQVVIEPEIEEYTEEIVEQKPDFANQFEDIQNHLLVSQPIEEPEKRESSLEMVEDFLNGNPASDLMKSEIVEQPVPVAEIKMPESHPAEVEAESEDEVLKRLYEEEMMKTNIQDQELLKNLIYMKELGYMNFTINYNLLKKYNNDVVVAVNALMNHMLSDSVFEMK